MWATGCCDLVTGLSSLPVIVSLCAGPRVGQQAHQLDCIKLIVAKCCCAACSALVMCQKGPSTMLKSFHIINLSAATYY